MRRDVDRGIRATLTAPCTGRICPITAFHDTSVFSQFELP